MSAPMLRIDVVPGLTDALIGETNIAQNVEGGTADGISKLTGKEATTATSLTNNRVPFIPNRRQRRRLSQSGKKRGDANKRRK